MPGLLNRIYAGYIRPTDPGFFIIRYAGKAMVSCLAAFLGAVALGLEGKFLFWWMAGAVCTILFRTGSTLGRRKGYALLLLAAGGIIVPVAALAGNHAGLSLAFIFILSFFCFFIACLGVSASTLGTGCLVLSLISVFSPAGGIEGLGRTLCLLAGGGLSFLTNFYLWPFDPEKILLSSAKLAVEDVGAFFKKVCMRMEHPETEVELTALSREAVAAVRRYRSFLESFNIDPLKGSRTAGGPGLFYFSLLGLFESIVGLSNHIHFSDGRSEFDNVRRAFQRTGNTISQGFDDFVQMRKGQYPRPDFDRIFIDIEKIQAALLDMGGYKQGDAVLDKYLEAWGAVYALKNTAEGLKDAIAAADERFGLGGGV